MNKSISDFKVVDDLARTIHDEFRQLPESQRIASKFALTKLSRLVQVVRPKTVLEIGAGIGTITKLLLRHPNRPNRLVSTESNPICISELKSNLRKEWLDGFELLSSPKDLDLARKHDLVVFDGVLEDSEQYSIIKKGTWCFIEGSRRSTVEAIVEKMKALNLDSEVHREFPGGRKIKWTSHRRFLNLRLPAIKFKPIKGCTTIHVT